MFRSVSDNKSLSKKGVNILASLENLLSFLASKSLNIEDCINATKPKYFSFSILQDTARNTYVCQFCYNGEGREGREHVIMSSESQLLALKEYVDEHLPSYFNYYHPLQKKEWLSELAKTVPTVALAGTQIPHIHTEEAWAEGIHGILAYYKNKNTLVETGHSV